MTTTSYPLTAAGWSELSPWRRFAAASPALAGAGAVFLALAALLLVPMLLDPRQWQGVSTWLKPWKFHASIAIQLLTMALFAHALAPEARRRLGTRIWFAVAIVCAGLEAIYITLMGALNTGSHFNVATPALATLYSVMGVGAVLLSASGASLGVQIARFPRPGLPPVLRWGLALALGLGWLLGSATGGVMASQANHWVGGLASDAGGLPLFGWSRSGGDLRVAHFFGLHATQGIALVAWWLQRRAARRPHAPGAERRALAGTVGVAVLWSLVTWALLAQALAGAPLVGH